MQQAREGVSPDKIFRDQTFGEEQVRALLAKCQCSPQQIDQSCQAMFAGGEANDEQDMPSSHSEQMPGNHVDKPNQIAHPTGGGSP
jgi:hypothetical protein